MRKTGVAATAVLVCVLAVAWTGSVAFGESGSGGGGGGGGGGGRTREVQVRDDCDPATFNAAIGAGACVGNGDVTFAQFQAKLNPQDFGHDDWRFNPDNTREHRGTTILARNRGGETHTFTAVAAFGPGCVAALNTPLGLTGPAATPDCPGALANTRVAPGATLTVRNLAPGTHRYMCVIHPWMRSTIVIRTD
jgi:plastocyanin